MNRIQDFSSGVIAEILRRQPTSAARTNLAWQLTVGAALARVTTVELADGTLTVFSRDERWLKEISRAKGVILDKMQKLLGTEDVRIMRL